jgi:hypothetical protein
VVLAACNLKEVLLLIERADLLRRETLHLSATITELALGGETPRSAVVVGSLLVKVLA